MAEHVAVEFTSAAGESLRFEWPAGALESLAPGGPDLPWRLGGELDWDGVDAVRVFSGRVEDGGIAIAAVRPRGAAGHGEEAISGVLLGEEGVERLDQVLLSTERDGSGAVRRIGLELYRAEGGMPLRIAGDATGSDDGRDGGVSRTSTAFELRAAGASGSGRLDVLTRG